MGAEPSLKITVVIATYRRPQSLRETLQSLVQQKRQADEVLVVDNNSGDETGAVVAEFAGSLRVKYLLEPRQGVSFARNTGVQFATGDVIAFTDDDCLCHPDWLYFLELPFLRDSRIGLVGGEILGKEIKGTLVERFCLADAMLRVSRVKS